MMQLSYPQFTLISGFIGKLPHQLQGSTSALHPFLTLLDDTVVFLTPALILKVAICTSQHAKKLSLTSTNTAKPPAESICKHPQTCSVPSSQGH